jgi:uncharacterized protein (TIGR02147 family)
MRHQDYRSLLMDEFKARQQTRQQFSMNAFAKFLGITPSHFNDILKKRRGLSDAKARSVAFKLQLSSFEEKFFLSSVTAQHGRSKTERAEAVEILEKIKDQKISVMKLDLFALVSQWQHFAILELTRVDAFQFSAKWISQQLGIDIDVARESLDRLVSTGLLVEKNQRWEAHKGILKTADDIPSFAIKSHHLQVMNLARKAIYDQDVQSREFTTLMMAFDATKIEKAKKRIREFQIEMSDLLTGSSKSRDSLYCFAMQFFSLLPVKKKG